MVRGRTALVTVACLAILVWPLLAAPLSETPAASLHLQSGCITTRVSVASDGTQRDYGSYGPSISGGGRYVAFTSEATNLVLTDTNATSDIFGRYRQTGLE